MLAFTRSTVDDADLLAHRRYFLISHQYLDKHAGALRLQLIGDFLRLDSDSRRSLNGGMLMLP